MAEHHVSVTVKAPIHQVYTLFTHFNDFPKFMSFVKEVTYYDDQRTHWVAQVLGRHEWDAINEDWVEDRQLGWRSTNGLDNSGKVKFLSAGPNETLVDVFIHYTPPAGILGEIVEKYGGDNHFDTVLQEDLNHFARMVEQAPPGALDPMSSHYLFHRQSAVAQGTTTDRQNASMAHDPMMSQQALEERQARIEREATAQRQAAAERQEASERQAALQRQAAQEQRAALEQQAARDQQESLEQQKALEQQAAQEQAARANQDSIHGTIGGRNAAMSPTPLGDRDARRERHPDYQQGPMVTRDPRLNQKTERPLSETEIESSWQRSIRGTHHDHDEETSSSQ
jgi:hypothetical protein